MTSSTAPDNFDEQKEPLIKDPIYDIMDDDEAMEAFDRLMELADEKAKEDDQSAQQKTHQQDDPVDKEAVG